MTSEPARCLCGKPPSVRDMWRGTRPYPHQVQCEFCGRRGPVAPNAAKAVEGWDGDQGAGSESVIPMDLDDGSRLYASAVSGGADYVDGMPRQVRLVYRDAEGNEVERHYLQTDERPLRLVAHERPHA